MGEDARNQLADGVVRDWNPGFNRAARLHFVDELLSDVPLLMQALDGELETDGHAKVRQGEDGFFHSVPCERWVLPWKRVSDAQ